METGKRKSFSVRMYLQDGHAGGVKIISKSKWSGRGLVIPRMALAQEKDREELQDPGICLLVEPVAENGHAKVSILAAEPICKALQDHDSSDRLWSAAIIFTCKENSLSETHFQYLAARLQQLAGQSQEISRIKSNHRRPALSESEQGDAETFLAHMLSLLPLFGVTNFVEH